MKIFLLIIFLNLIIESSAQVRDFEGNLYDTVQIGNQTWLKQNLKSKYYYDGYPVTAKYYVYNDDLEMLNTYGYLYSYQAMTRGSTILPMQGICPQYFHIPTIEEWSILINYIGGKSNDYNSYSGGKYLKDNINWNGINTYSFSLLPGGTRAWPNVYEYFGTEAWMWACNGNPNGQMVLYFTYADIIFFLNILQPPPEDGLSCRCVKATKASINEEKQDSCFRNVKVYPNPVSDIINIYTNVSLSGSEILIYNSLGKLMFASAFKNSLIITDYPAGLYILILKTDSNKEYKTVFIKK